MNVTLVSQARTALEEGVLGKRLIDTPMTYHVALLIPQTSDTFFGGLTEGVLSASHRIDAAVQIFRYRAQAPNDLETYFQLSLSSHIDGVIVYSGLERMQSHRRQAETEHVVFIPVGTRAPDGTELFVGSSSFLQGVEGGNIAVRHRGSSARIGIVLPSEGQEKPQADPMYRGILMTLQSFPGASIVAASRANPGLFSGEEAVTSLLRAQPSVNVLICGNALITEGAAQVVVDQGLVGQVVLIGTDESPAINKMVERGVIAATIVRDSRQMGEQAVKAFLRALRGGTSEPPIEVGFKVREHQDGKR